MVESICALVRTPDMELGRPCCLGFEVGSHVLSDLLNGPGRVELSRDLDAMELSGIDTSLDRIGFIDV